jgi:hypothetical protein
MKFYNGNGGANILTLNATNNGVYVSNGPFNVGANFTITNSGALGGTSALFSGNVGIGTTSPDEKLTVNGTIHSIEVKVTPSVPTPDYVFEPDYKLTSLEELKAYVDKNHHLPEIPSAKEIEKNGIQLGDMNMKLLKKVEELTLYLIEKDNNDKEKDAQLQLQQNQINQLKEQLSILVKTLIIKN